MISKKIGGIFLSLFFMAIIGGCNGGRMTPGQKGSGWGSFVELKPHRSPSPAPSPTPVASATPISSSGSTPFTGTPLLIPGLIEAENFDNGGEGIAYHDTTVGNTLGAYRNTDVDVGSCTDGTSCFRVGYSDVGEWLIYTINVAQSGTYTIETRASTDNVGRSIHFEVDGVNVSGSISIPSTTSWLIWESIFTSGIQLTAGIHHFKVYEETGYTDLNYFNLTLGAVPSPTPSPAVNWPVMQSIPVGATPILTALSEPGYLQWVQDPGTVYPYFPSGGDPSVITKITDPNAFGLPSETFFKIEYSKVPAWNADDSLMLVFRDGNSPSYTRGVLLDGQTFQWKKNLTYASSGGRWSNVEPTKFFYINYSLPELDVSDVLLDDTHTVRNFSDIGYTASAGSAGMFGYEGRQSNDDRYWALEFGTSSGQWDILIYDKTANAVTGKVLLPALAVSNFIDNWSISQLGRFLVIQSTSSWTSRDGISVPAGTSVWSLSGQYLRYFPEGSGGSHQDYAIDANGNDVLFFIDSKYATNDHIGQTWRLDGANGNQTVDQFTEMIGWAYHLSAANTSRPGWAIVTSMLDSTPSNYNWAPMWNHTFAVKLDGSLKIGPIATLHHANTTATANQYNRMPFGCPNRHLSAVAWGGTWGDADISGPINTYVARPK